MNQEFLKTLRAELKNTPQKAQLVAVTKYSDVDEINAAIDLEVTKIGENRIESLEEKLPYLFPVEKHFIGVIQSKKLRRILGASDVIQSISSIEQLEKLNRIAEEENKKARVYLQINISAEVQKSGFHPDSLEAHIATIKNLRHVVVEGIMAMAEDTDNEMDIRMQFRLARRVYEDLQKEILTIKELSIGMSGDYKIALEEGATMLRIGSKIFK